MPSDVVVQAQPRGGDRHRTRTTTTTASSNRGLWWQPWSRKRSRSMISPLHHHQSPTRRQAWHYIAFTALCSLLVYSVVLHPVLDAVSATTARRGSKPSEERVSVDVQREEQHPQRIYEAHETAAGAAAGDGQRKHRQQQQQDDGGGVVVATSSPPASRDIFSSYSCQGDDMSKGGIYNAPFRFHVYNDMPKELLDDVIERARKYWQPDHSNNQFTAELGLALDLPLHPCHTEDPNEADAFIVPVQTVSMIWLEKEDGRHDGGRTAFAKVMKWLETKETYQRTKGRDHYAMGIAWDTGRRPFGDINLLGPETPTDFQDTFSFPLDKYMHAQHDIVIPYPDPDSIKHYAPEALAGIKRDNLAVFVGSMVSTAPVRRVIYNQMKDFNAHHDGPKALWKNLAHQATTEELRNLLPSAVFGPVMTGDSYSSRRLFSLLFAGTIPVIICDRLMLPYEDVLDYSAFAIFFSEQDLLSNPKSNIFDILSKLPASEVERLQANGRKAIKHFTFSEGRPQPGDAFDMFVRQLASVNFNNRRLKNMLRRASYKTLPSN